MRLPFGLTGRCARRASPPPEAPQTLRVLEWAVGGTHVPLNRAECSTPRSPRWQSSAGRSRPSCAVPGTRQRTRAGSKRPGRSLQARSGTRAPTRRLGIFPSPSASAEHLRAAPRGCGARFTVGEDGGVETKPEPQLWYPQEPRGPLRTGDRNAPTSGGVRREGTDEAAQRLGKRLQDMGVGAEHFLGFRGVRERRLLW